MSTSAEQRRRWREKNPDKVAAQKRRWRARRLAAGRPGSFGGLSRDEWNAYQRAYRKKNRAKFRAYARNRYYRLKDLFLKMYGEACALCGERDSVVLTMDHVAGDGAAWRRKHSPKHPHSGGGARAWAEACKVYRPDLFRVLCCNCQHRERVRLQKEGIIRGGGRPALGGL